MTRNAIVLSLLAILCAVAACDEASSPFGDSKARDQYCEFPPTSEDRVTITQGIWGDVWLWEGSFMPVGCGTITPVSREICIFEAVSESDVAWDKRVFGDECANSCLYAIVEAELVATVRSDDLGFFEVTLEPGIYSLFVKMGDHYYTDGGSGDFFHPVDVRRGMAAGTRIDITCDATF